MGKRGPKPRRVVNTTWSPNLAYAVGLLASDGYLATGQYLVELTSKDIEQVQSYRKCLGIEGIKIGKKLSGMGISAYRVQFKNRLFYEWLQDVGLTPKKSKTIGALKIPRKYFMDFFRGVIDGDGCFHSYYDPRWRSSFMFYLILTSGSDGFVRWIRGELESCLGVCGHVTFSKKKDTYQLKYAKAEASKIIEKMYYSPEVVCLVRKREKIEKALRENDLTK